jgi:hypothetical protein
MSTHSDPDRLPDPRGVDVDPLPGSTPPDDDPDGNPPHGGEDTPIRRIYPDDPTGA